MSDIFSGNDFASVSEKDWRRFLDNAQRPLIDAPSDTRVSRTADFARQLEKAQRDEINATQDIIRSRERFDRDQERAAEAAEKTAVRDTKELEKLGLPNISEQKQLPLNWFEAQKATGYDALPFTEQSKIYNDWLDQAQVRIVTADRSKAKTAREELEKRIPAPVKPKAALFDTDILDKINEGARGIAKSAYRSAASYMPEGSIKNDLYARAALSEENEKAARAGMNPETLDAEKTVALRNQALNKEYGGEDNIPFLVDAKNSVANLFQGGTVQAIGNIGKSIPAAAPSLIGNAMTIGGTMMSATGAGAVVGVPLALAGRAVSTLGGAAATAADVGGQAWEEAYAFAKSQGLGEEAARAKAEEASRTGSKYGAGIGAVEGFLGGAVGAGAIAKAGVTTAAKRIGIEAGLGGVAEGAGQTSVNSILQDQGDQRSLMRGVGGAVAQGAISEAGMTVGMQAVASAVGTEAQKGPVALQNTPAAVQAGTNAASAAINTVAQLAQAAVVQAQAAVQAAQATGDDTQVAAATAALQAATAQAQAVGQDPVAATPMDALKAAAAAQDGLDAAIATGDPVQIEQATQAVNVAINNIAAQATNTPVPAIIDTAGSGEVGLPGVVAGVDNSVSDIVLSAENIDVGDQRKQGVLTSASVEGVSLMPGYDHLGKNTPGNYATSVDQLIVDATPVQDGIYRTEDGTLLDTGDSMSQVALNPGVQALLKSQGFDGFRTEAGETFAFSSVDPEQLPALDKQLAATIASISYSITDPATTDAQRLKYVAKFLNGTLEPALMDVVNRTGVGLTARAAIETQAPWAEAVMSSDDTLLQVLATSKSDIGEGPAEQARAVLRMYAESGQDLPKIVKIRGLIPFDNDTALGVYDPVTHRIEISDLADPGHIIHEYLHGVTQLGIDAVAASKDGKALKQVMQHMLTAMRTTAVRAGEAKPYALTNEHEMMGDLFNPAFLRIAAQTPIGTPASKSAQALIKELMGEKPSTLIELLDAIIRKIVSYLGVKTVPNNMAELLSRVAARATDETRKAVNEGITPGDASRNRLASLVVMPPSAVPLSAATFKNQLTGRTSSASYIASISAGVNVQPVLQINKIKALAQGDETQTKNLRNKLNDAIHDSQGPAKRWLQALPISANARERIINVLYLAPGKRDTILNNAMEKHGGDAMIKALAAIKKGAKGLTHETVTMWVGHWITANHVAEKNAMLITKRAETHRLAVVAMVKGQANSLRLQKEESKALQAYTAASAAVTAQPGDLLLQQAEAKALQAHRAAIAAVTKAPTTDFRLQLAAAEALQAYTDQVKAVSSTNLDAGSEDGPPHAMGVAGGMNNAQAAATMQAVEAKFDVAQLKAVADAVYDMNAFRLALDIENGKTQVSTVAKFLSITADEQARLQELQDARAAGTVTEAMRDAARAIVRSEYVPMTGHPLSAIDDPTEGLFSTGAAQPNTGKDYVMEGRTRGIADNGIATSMKGLIRSATFAGYADFTSGIGEVFGMLTPDQRTAVGLSKESINGLTRGSDNVLLDGRTNNTVGYSIQDANVLDAIRAGNVDEQDGLLRKFAMPTTRMFAYLVTQANPLFGPKNLINDMIERSLIASTREYYTETGAKVTIGATDVIASSPASMAAVNRLIRGKADYSNDADAALRDFIDAGGLSTSREAFARDAKALAQRVRGIGTGANPRVAVRAVGDWIEKYNKQFDMVAPLSSYLALRSAGVSKVDAAGGALDLMNYRKKGAKTSGFITPMYAFAQPAFTGGANLLKMLGTAKGQKIAVTSLVAFLALQALSEAGADEDEGGDLIRQLPNYARNNNINVQIGSNVASIPVGFGVTKLANTAARAILDYGNKRTSIPKAIYDVMSEGFMTSLTPFEDNDLKDPVKNILYGTTPTVLKGAAGYALNARADGGQIDREKWIDQGKYRHMQGSKTIAPAYRDMAEMLYAATGWDMTPDAMKYLVQSYGIGPFKHVVANTITNPQKEAEGKDTGLPAVGSFIAPVFKPLNEDAWRGQMRKAQEDMDDMRKEADKLEADKTGEGRVALRELQARPEYRLMGEFDKLDKALRAEAAAVTRSLNKKQITATEEERRRESIRGRRKDSEAQLLVKWRKMKGLE